PFERIGPYRIGFYSEDVTSGEPPHVHVVRERNEIKIWLRDLTIHSNRGFNARAERKIRRVIERYQTHFLERWEEYSDNL
ncbi:MAG: DUF4160 domain-containing protein, partial [Chloroflexota bacterium]